MPKYGPECLSRHTLSELFKGTVSSSIPCTHRLLVGLCCHHFREAPCTILVRPNLECRDIVYHLRPIVCEFNGTTIFSRLIEKLASVQYSATFVVTGAWGGGKKLYVGLHLFSFSLNIIYTQRNPSANQNT